MIRDWYDEDSVAAAMQDAGKVLVVTPDLFTDETVVTPNIIRAARRAGGVELIVRLLVVAKPLREASGLPVTFVNVPAWIMFSLGLFVAADVKPHCRIAMPKSTDSPPMWVSEGDVAAVIARILTDPVADHVGKEYTLTAPERLTYADIATVFADVLGEPVVYADEDGPLRTALGRYYEPLMTYFRCEYGTYAGVVHDDAIMRLLGRPADTMRDYVTAHAEDYR